MRRLALVLIAATATPAAAADIVAPEAFEAMSEGHTLHFSLDGAPFGAEQYFPGRRSLWRFADGACAPGRWRADGPAVCFVYDGEAAAPICWLFLRDGSRFSAHLLEGGAEAGFSLDLDRIADAPLACPGPPVGS